MLHVAGHVGSEQELSFAARQAEWAYQVHRYRESVALFQQVLHRRARQRATPQGLTLLKASRDVQARPRAFSDISKVKSIRTALTPRQLEIATLIAGGLSNSEIADRLVVTKGTVANHVEHILRRLGFHCRTQVAVWAVEQGLLTAGAQTADGRLS